jgi:hypothetical protein
MKKKQSTHSHHVVARMGRFVQHLFSAPFESLPSAFGDQTPPDIKILEAEVDEARHDVVESPGSPEAHKRSSKPMWRK